MKFDMGRAWSDAMALLRGNRDVVLVVAAVFFFLPYLAMILLLPDFAASLNPPAASDPADASAVLEQMTRIYAEIWWAMLLLIMIQAVGMLGLLALLTDRGRPTVGEALKTGLICLIPYLLAQILISIICVLVIMVPIMAGALAGIAGAVLLGIVAVVALLYLVTKFSLTPPVIAIERVLNPITALQRSWQLTKGNSLRLFLFYLLLIIALIVVSIVVGFVVALVGVIGGPDSGLIVTGVLNGLFNMLFLAVFLAVLAAAHRQLAGPSGEAIGETFE